MSQAPKIAMVLAAGLGTRMRPLTNDRPKALVEVAGKALIDHMLDRLVAASVETAVVNVHYFADLVEAHLRAREAKGLAPRIVISDERVQALETGGGIKHALALLGEGPVFVANIDSIWIEHAGAAVDPGPGPDPGSYDAGRGGPQPDLHPRPILRNTRFPPGPFRPLSPFGSRRGLRDRSGRGARRRRRPDRVAPASGRAFAPDSARYRHRPRRRRPARRHRGARRFRRT